MITVFVVLFTWVVFKMTLRDWRRLKSFVRNVALKNRERPQNEIESYRNTESRSCRRGAGRSAGGGAGPCRQRPTTVYVGRHRRPRPGGLARVLRAIRAGMRDAGHARARRRVDDPSLERAAADQPMGQRHGQADDRPGALGRGRTLELSR